MSSTSANQQQVSPIRRLASISSVIGGGVVGADYATWIEVDPIVGTVLGSFISWSLTTILFKLRDAQREIATACSWVGGLLGCVAGTYLGYGFGVAELAETPVIYGFGGFLFGFAAGAIAGQIAAALISFCVVALLFISQGPVGNLLRGLVLQANDSEPVSLGGDEIFGSLATQLTDIVVAFA